MIKSSPQPSAFLRSFTSARSDTSNWAARFLRHVRPGLQHLLFPQFRPDFLQQDLLFGHAQHGFWWRHNSPGPHCLPFAHQRPRLSHDEPFGTLGDIIITGMFRCRHLWKPSEPTLGESAYFHCKAVCGTCEPSPSSNSGAITSTRNRNLPFEIA